MPLIGSGGSGGSELDLRVLKFSGTLDSEGEDTITHLAGGLTTATVYVTITSDAPVQGALEVHILSDTSALIQSQAGSEHAGVAYRGEFRA